MNGDESHHFRTDFFPLGIGLPFGFEELVQISMNLFTFRSESKPCGIASRAHSLASLVTSVQLFG